MPLFYYSGFNPNGKRISGYLEGHNEKEVKGRLRARGMMVTQLTIKTGTSKERLKGEQLLTFTLQLSQLINAGVPIYDSLLALEEQYHAEPFHRVILSLCEQIKTGTHLSEAMASFPETFDTLYCSMVRAGELSGSLGPTLEKLSDLIGKQLKVKRDLITALIYPSILAGAALLIIALLLGFVIPSVEGIFTGRDLNRFTLLVIGTSHFFRRWWWLYLPLGIGLTTLLFFRLRSKEGVIWLQNISLRIPLIKQLIIKAAVARFCRTMGTLQEGGATIIDSLRIARAVMNNAVLEEEVRHAEERIIEGSSLSAELRHSKWIPHLVPRLLAVGEESGTLGVMLGKVATMYEADLEKTVERLLALAQPVILITMGLAIGAVLLAILLPLTDMGSFALT